MTHWCWRCGWKRFEWLGRRISIQRRFRCFYCRVDALDRKYGPSMMAEIRRNQSKAKVYSSPGLTRWELLKIKTNRRFYKTPQ